MFWCCVDKIKIIFDNIYVKQVQCKPGKLIISAFLKDRTPFPSLLDFERRFNCVNPSTCPGDSNP